MLDASHCSRSSAPVEAIHPHMSGSGSIFHLHKQLHWLPCLDRPHKYLQLNSLQIRRMTDALVYDNQSYWYMLPLDRLASWIMRNCCLVQNTPESSDAKSDSLKPIRSLASKQVILRPSPKYLGSVGFM